MTEDRRVVTLEGPSVLLVSESDRVHDALYSGRSSWSDLKDIDPGSGESVTLVTSDGKEHSGKVAAVDENQVTLS